MADRESFADDVLEHAPQLYAHALRTTRNRADAEDLLQETYVRAWRGYDGFEQGTNLRAWLFRIMTNLYINRYRQSQRRPDEESLDEIEDFILYKRIAANGHGGVAPSAEDQLMVMFTDDEVLAALDSMNALQRQMLLLREVEGFSYKEIAEILAVPIGTVMSGLNRGRNVLEKTLHDYALEKGLVSS